MITDQDLVHLRRCVELAEEAVGRGDAPFGSVLVDGNGQVLRVDGNRTVTGENGDMKADATLHPEFTLARWAQLNVLSNEARAKCTVYTSGEHCPMCSAAHAWVGLGRIVYVSSSEQYVGWMREAGVLANVVAPLAINQIAPGIQVDGPVPELAEKVKALHHRRWEAKQAPKKEA